MTNQILGHLEPKEEEPGPNLGVYVGQLYDRIKHLDEFDQEMILRSVGVLLGLDLKRV